MKRAHFGLNKNMFISPTTRLLRCGMMSSYTHKVTSARGLNGSNTSLFANGSNISTQEHSELKMYTSIIVALLVGVFALTADAQVKGKLTASNGTDASVGVCHVEVPTVSLVADSHGAVPKSNGTKAGHSVIQVCCKGYRRHPHIFRRCQPVCGDGCVNANCTAPNVCTCWAGYILDRAGNCVPTCPIGCLNGVCTTDNYCSCDAGYTLDAVRPFCVPTCRSGCRNGNCTMPDTCECLAGFRKDASGECNYHCEGGCGGAGGECVGPNKCACRAGYVQRGGGGGTVCEPQCDGGCGVGGLCTAPNVCTCPNGAVFDGKKRACVAHCEHACLNGVCVAPDVCECNKGYALDAVKRYKCVPACPRGCLNGVCTAPNFCVCNPGFVKDRSVKGSPVCAPAPSHVVRRHLLLP